MLLVHEKNNIGSMRNPMNDLSQGVVCIYELNAVGLLVQYQVRQAPLEGKSFH